MEVHAQHTRLDKLKIGLDYVMKPHPKNKQSVSVRYKYGRVSENSNIRCKLQANT